MKPKPEESISIRISRENDKSESAHFIETTLQDCFERITKALDQKKIRKFNTSKTNNTVLLFREYSKKNGSGKSLIYKLKGMSPEEVFEFIVDKFY